MFEIRKLFVRGQTAGRQACTDVQDVSLEDVHDEFKACVLEVFGSARIERSCFELELHPSGPLQDGRHVLSANVRLVKWDRVSGVRLLVGLPILERGARRAIAASWASGSAHFGGLWLHPSGGILERDLMKELGRDLAMLEGAGPFSHLDSSPWSGHVELGDRQATDWARV